MTLTDGLVRVEAPALPRGFQIKCTVCGWTVGSDHEAGSFDCIEGRHERDVTRHAD